MSGCIRVYCESEKGSRAGNASIGEGATRREGSDGSSVGGRFTQKGGGRRRDPRYGGCTLPNSGAEEGLAGSSTFDVAVHTMRDREGEGEGGGKTVCQVLFGLVQRCAVVCL